MCVGVCVCETSAVQLRRSEVRTKFDGTLLFSSRASMKTLDETLRDNSMPNVLRRGAGSLATV